MFRHHRTSLLSNRSFVSDLRISRPSRVSYFYLQTIVLFKEGVGSSLYFLLVSLDKCSPPHDPSSNLG